MVASLSLVAVTDPVIAAEPLSSPGRQALADAIAAVAQAQAAFAEADRPVQAANEDVARSAEANRKLAELRAARERMIDEWAATGRLGDRPKKDFAEQAAEAAAADAQIEAESAERRLPAALPRRQASLQVLNAASAQQQAALCEAAVDAAAEWVAAKLTPAIEAVLRAEVPLESLRRALWLRGQGGNPIPSAAGAAGRIVEMITAAKRDAGVEHDYAAGDEFLNRLAADPAGRL
jgi:hypothetical protein